MGNNINIIGFKNNSLILNKGISIRWLFCSPKNTQSRLAVPNNCSSHIDSINALNKNKNIK